MTIIPFGSCLQVLELSERADSVTRHSHEIERALIITIIHPRNLEHTDNNPRASWASTSYTPVEA